MFICPGCGCKIDEEDDLIICDECFREAKAIRAIRSQLAETGLTPAAPDQTIERATVRIPGPDGVYEFPLIPDVPFGE